MKILKDQRGLTIVELVSSFTITMLTLVFLFNIVVILKENYVLNSTKSDLIVEQSLISRAINEDLYNGATDIVTVTCTGYDLCYDIGLSDGSSKKLMISYDNNELKYGDLVLTHDSFDIQEANTEICYYSEESASDEKNSFLYIRVDFDSDLLENYEYGITVIHPYSTVDFVVDPSIGSC